MTRPQQYLTRIIVFLVAVSLVALVLMPRIIQAFMANPALNGLILGTLVIGIVYVVRQVVSLRQEVNWIEEFRRSDSLSGVTSQPRLLAPMAAMLGEERIVSLSALSTRTLLDGIASRIDESREISRYLIGLLIFLGLLGTFWGLVQTIGSIGATIRNLSITSTDLTMVFDALKEGLEAPLAGMGTAFSSSLFGLSGSLILGFVDLQAGQAQNRFYNDLEDWLSSVTKLGRGGSLPVTEGEQSVPSYVAALLEQTAESLDRLQRTIGRAEEDRGGVNAAIRNLADRLETITEQRRAEQELLVKLVDAQNETRAVLSRLADSLGAIKSPAPVDDATRSHLRNLDQHVKHLVDDAERSRDQFVNDIRGEIKLLARTIGAAVDNAVTRIGETRGDTRGDTATANAPASAEAPRRPLSAPPRGSDDRS